MTTKTTNRETLTMLGVRTKPETCTEPGCNRAAFIMYANRNLCSCHWDTELLKNEIALDVTESIVDGIAADLEGGTE